VKVALGPRSYDVLIGSGVIDRLGKLVKSETKKAVLISDKNLPEHRARTIKALTAAGWNVFEIAVEAGEGLKDFAKLYPIYGDLLKAGIDRSSTLFALGGGTVGDAAGFIAATYLRGIPWVGIPTTLLGQVDSSIGGKTAVNHPLGKNLVGSFYQPALVICETDFLKTLSSREIVSGLGEVVKYGLTFDRNFFKYVQKNWQAAVSLNSKVIQTLVAKSAAFKAKAVSKDEFDRKGTREVLNFGHTFGHALESVTGYTGFQHGEAVLWGMRFALALSKPKMKPASYSEAKKFLFAIPLPPLPDVKPEAFFKPMQKDKKAKDGKVRFVLLKDIGRTVLDRNISELDLEDALKEVKRG
jgi:3-dehydroquinate synthase